MEKDEKIIVHIDPEIADFIPGFLKNRWESTVKRWLNMSPASSACPIPLR
ncbi:MAG: hypothetical protein KAX38_01455 [Candidatus Krumholzibacteria bacterium]|nr:hypothetical protein [Candidatus Krumholzibacteria bacterium]